MHQVNVRELHLAAFMKVNGASLLRVDNGLFVFNTDKSMSEWRVSHSNSCCRKVDRELLDLRKLIKGYNNG